LKGNEMVIEKVRKLLAIARYKSAIYIKSEGATCPVCAFLGERPARVSAYKTDGDVRYHKCGRCGCNFKSVEEKEIEISKIPEKRDKPTELKQNKSRTRRK
jgi:hypothetical protein